MSLSIMRRCYLGRGDLVSTKGKFPDRSQQTTPTSRPLVDRYSRSNSPGPIKPVMIWRQLPNPTSLPYVGCAIALSHQACKAEFRGKFRSDGSVFFFLFPSYFRVDLVTQHRNYKNLSRDEEALGFQLLVLRHLVHPLLLEAGHLLRGECVRKLPLKEGLEQPLLVGCALSVVRLDKEEEEEEEERERERERENNRG